MYKQIVVGTDGSAGANIAVERAIDQFVGIAPEGKAIARHGQRVLVAGKEAGEVTSGTYSFTLDHSIATASLDGDTPTDADLSIDIRGTVAAAAVVPLPFYRRPKGA